MILGIHKVLTHPRVYTRTKWPWSFKLNLLKKMDEKLKEISTCNICFVFHLISWSKICFLLWEVPVPFADLFFHSCLLFLPNKPLSIFCCFFTLFFVKLTILFKNFLLLCEAIVLHSFLKFCWQLQTPLTWMTLLQGSSSRMIRIYGSRMLH